MKCKGEFIFKSLEKRESGEFTNDKGETVKYDSCYILKVDEVNGKEINERKLKVNKDNTVLYNKLKDTKPYTAITLEFAVTLYNGNAKVVPVDLVEVK